MCHGDGGEGERREGQSKQSCFFPRIVVRPEPASCDLGARRRGRGILFQPDEFMQRK